MDVDETTFDAVVAIWGFVVVEIWGNLDVFAGNILWMHGNDNIDGCDDGLCDLEKKRVETFWFLFGEKDGMVCWWFDDGMDEFGVDWCGMLAFVDEKRDGKQSEFVVVMDENVVNERLKGWAADGKFVVFGGGLERKFGLVIEGDFDGESVVNSGISGSSENSGLAIVVCCWNGNNCWNNANCSISKQLALRYSVTVCIETLLFCASHVCTFCCIYM